MGIGGRCAACKYLRKRCPTDCIFSPYFPPNDPLRFEYVHRIYGASNVARMLQRIRVDLREEAAETLYFEAHCRVKDPVYGCVRIIDELQQQILEAHSELSKAQTQIALVLDAIGPSSEPVIDHLNNNDYSSSYYYNDGLLPFDLPTLGL